MGQAWQYLTLKLAPQYVLWTCILPVPNQTYQVRICMVTSQGLLCTWKVGNAGSDLGCHDFKENIIYLAIVLGPNLNTCFSFCLIFKILAYCEDSK